MDRSSGSKGVSAPISAHAEAAPTIGILTALPKEYAAVEVLLQNTKEVSVQGERGIRRYTLGEVPLTHGGKLSIVLALLPTMGTNMAGIWAGHLLDCFPQVQEIIMVGIAGGIPYPEKYEEHVRLGDIVVSDQYGVIQYDFVKQTKGKTIFRPLPRPPSPNLL